MTGQIVLYGFVALALIGLVQVLEVALAFFDRRGWLDGEEPLPWEQDERGAV